MYNGPIVARWLEEILANQATTASSDPVYDGLLALSATADPNPNLVSCFQAARFAGWLESSGLCEEYWALDVRFWHDLPTDLRPKVWFHSRNCALQVHVPSNCFCCDKPFTRGYYGFAWPGTKCRVGVALLVCAACGSKFVPSHNDLLDDPNDLRGLLQTVIGRYLSAFWDLSRGTINPNDKSNTITH